jgi:hypothetical protein
MKGLHVLRTIEYGRISGVAHLAWISDAMFLGKLVVACAVADIKQNEVVDPVAQLYTSVINIHRVPVCTMHSSPGSPSNVRCFFACASFSSDASSLAFLPRSSLS